MKIKILIIALALTTISLVLATSKDDIQYPIKSLNNCANEAECKKYCGDPQPDRVRACLQVAREHNLMTAQQIAAAEKALNIVGPGGCKGPACKTYCQSSDPAHMQECLGFGIKNHKLISEFDEDFAEEDVEEMEIVLAYLERGGKMPPGCSDKDSCMAACQNPANIDTCMEMGTAIGTATGKMTPEQAASPAFKQMMRIMMTEGGPEVDGVPCRFDECDEIDEEEWLPWMKAHGINPMEMMPPEAKAEMMQGMMQIDKMLATAPAEVRQCVEKALGGTTEDVRAGRLVPNPDVRYEIEDCMMDQFSGMMGGGTGFGGPDEEYDDEEYDDEEGDEGDIMKKMMPPGIPRQCQSQDPQAVMKCMMDYCMKSFMGGTPDPACMSAMQQGVSSLVSNNQFTAQSSNIFERFVDWVLGR